MVIRASIQATQQSSQMTNTGSKSEKSPRIEAMEKNLEELKLSRQELNENQHEINRKLKMIAIRLEEMGGNMGTANGEEIGGDLSPSNVHHQSINGTPITLKSEEISGKRSRESLGTNWQFQIDRMHQEDSASEHHPNLFDEMSEREIDADYERTLVVTVHDDIYPITIEILHQLFDPFGIIEKIEVLPNRSNFQALVSYQWLICSHRAKFYLHGHHIYVGCCIMEIQHASKRFMEEVAREARVELVHQCLEDIRKGLREMSGKWSGDSKEKIREEVELEVKREESKLAANIGDLQVEDDSIHQIHELFDETTHSKSTLVVEETLHFFNNSSENYEHKELKVSGSKTGENEVLMEIDPQGFNQLSVTRLQAMNSYQSTATLHYHPNEVTPPNMIMSSPKLILEMALDEKAPINEEKESEGAEGSLTLNNEPGITYNLFDPGGGVIAKWTLPQLSPSNVAKWTLLQLSPSNVESDFEQVHSAQCCFVNDMKLTQVLHINGSRNIEVIVEQLGPNGDVIKFECIDSGIDWMEGNPISKAEAKFSAYIYIVPKNGKVEDKLYCPIKQPDQPTPPPEPPPLISTYMMPRINMNISVCEGN